MLKPATLLASALPVFLELVFYLAPNNSNKNIQIEADCA
jgi:hypothetical protein